MAVEFNEQAFKHARKLIERGDFAADDRDKWSEDQPSTDDENLFIDENGIEEYGKWYLGVNTGKPKDSKGHYEFPFGDFEKVHRGGVISAESRAGQYGHTDIRDAARDLLSMMDKAVEKQKAR